MAILRVNGNHRQLCDLHRVFGFLCVCVVEGRVEGRRGGRGV